MLRNAYILFAAFCLGSCSFNKVYLQPQKLSKTTQKFRMVNPGTKDTTVIYFNGENLQPDIRDGRGEPKEISYSIDSRFIKSASGNNIHTWFIKPKAFKKPEGTILFLHGNGGNILNHLRYVLPLAQRGYQVMMVDYSGYGFSDGTATIPAVRKDAGSALQWLHQQPGVRDGKLIVYGQSLGGHLAAIVAHDNEQLVDGLVIEGAFSSHKDIGAKNMPILGRAIVKEHYSAFNTLPKFHKPVLIIHSREDETIPFYMGKKLYGAANPPKQFYAISHAHIEGPIHYADSIAYKIRQMLQS